MTSFAATTSLSARNEPVRSYAPGSSERASLKQALADMAAEGAKCERLLAVARALDRLRNSAVNVHVNDRPTGAVVGQQSFGGARASGTNDKAGSMWNLARWVSPRTIKEIFVAPSDFRYPSMAGDV